MPTAAKRVAMPDGAADEMKCAGRNKAALDLGNGKNRAIKNVVDLVEQRPDLSGRPRSIGYINFTFLIDCGGNLRAKCFAGLIR